MTRESAVVPSGPWALRLPGLCQLLRRRSEYQRVRQTRGSAARFCALVGGRLYPLGRAKVQLVDQLSLGSHGGDKNSSSSLNPKVGSGDWTSAPPRAANSTSPNLSPPKAPPAGRAFAGPTTAAQFVSTVALRDAPRTLAEPGWVRRGRHRFDDLGTNLVMKRRGCGTWRPWFEV